MQFGPLIIGTRSMTHQMSFRNCDYAYILAPLQEVDGSRDKDIRLVSPTQREPTRMPHNQELFWDVHQATDMFKIRSERAKSNVSRNVNFCCQNRYNILCFGCDLRSGYDMQREKGFWAFWYTPCHCEKHTWMVQYDDLEKDGQTHWIPFMTHPK